VFHVRNHFLLKLAEILPTQRLQPRWNVLPILVAKDPAAENIQLVSFFSFSLFQGEDSLSDAGREYNGQYSESGSDTAHR
jgi:sister-chromatid-cohesion protein PDS5